MHQMYTPQFVGTVLAEGNLKGGELGAIRLLVAIPTMQHTSLAASDNKSWTSPFLSTYTVNSFCSRITLNWQQRPTVTTHTTHLLFQLEVHIHTSEPLLVLKLINGNGQLMGEKKGIHVSPMRTLELYPLIEQNWRSIQAMPQPYELP